MPELCIVLPAYNEARALEAGKLAEVAAWAAARTPPASLLVVDDGSTDGTAERVRGMGVRLLQLPHGGKAAALSAGIRAAEAEWLLLADMDLATPIAEADGLLAALARGADIVLGSRGHARAGAPLFRRVLSLGHWALCRVLTGLPWSDTQCGFKAFRGEAALAVLARLRRYGTRPDGPVKGPRVNSGFDVEVLVVAREMGLRIEEAPVTWHYRDTRRVAKLRDAWRGVADLAAIGRAARRGAYRAPCGGASG